MDDTQPLIITAQDAKHLKCCGLSSTLFSCSVFVLLILGLALSIVDRKKIESYGQDIDNIYTNTASPYASACDDLKVCTDDFTIFNGKCMNTPKPNHGYCDSVCLSQKGVCIAGECVGKSAGACSDSTDCPLMDKKFNETFTPSCSFKNCFYSASFELPGAFKDSCDETSEILRSFCLQSGNPTYKTCVRADVKCDSPQLGYFTCVLAFENAYFS